MGCSSCSTNGGCGTTPNGCGDKGHCATGGCNKMNTFDWLADMVLPEDAALDLVEISFKNGVRKEFFRKPSFLNVVTGDMVAVESGSGGYDIGRVSLSGELVRLQMKKKKIKANGVFPNVLRIANERDLERLQEARSEERDTMIKGRSISNHLGLNMKIGEVEYQGDKRKATFYYTADGRVDFRELIRIFAREFKVKIEMRQIGARQESALIGGLGPCGRELCCSTWLSDFKSVSTAAARYQNLAINQSKLSGQCGRLKCCLNFELNTYLDALREFPKNVDRLETQKGNAFLLKTDIFKRIMFFAIPKNFGGLDVFPLSVDRVHEIIKMNKKGQKPADLMESIVEMSKSKKNSEEGMEFIDGAGSLELSQLEEQQKRGKKRRKKKPQQGQNQGRGPKPTTNTTKTEAKTEETGAKTENKETGPKQGGNQQKRSRNRGKQNQKRTGPKPNTEKKEGAANNEEKKSVENKDVKKEGGPPNQEKKTNRNNNKKRRNNKRKHNPNKKGDGTSGNENKDNG